MTEYLLQATGITLQAGQATLLQGLDLHIEVGERVALVGPSGCGKSTLLRALARLDEPAAGTILLAGAAPAPHEMPAYRRRVIYVHQRPILQAATVHENLSAPFMFASASKEAFPTDKAEALLDRLGVGKNSLQQDARSLSIGQQQRVCLIRAALLDPKILLLDEPTSALDPEATRLVEAWITGDLSSAQRGALIVSHDPAQAARLCDRVIDLREMTAAYLASRSGNTEISAGVTP